MLVRPCVVLDGAMSVYEVITRLARQGYWLDSSHPAVRAVIAETAGLVNKPFEEVEKDLAREFSLVGAAIRRQWYANVLWYARPLYFVMIACYAAQNNDQALFLALDLHEEDNMPLLDMPAADTVPHQEGVIYARGMATAVALDSWGTMDVGTSAADAGQPTTAKPAAISGTGALFSRNEPASRSRGQRATPPSAMYAARPQPIEAWPRIDAPKYVPARKPFEVVVGLAASEQPGVIGGKVVIQPPPGAKTVDVNVTLVAEGLDVEAGWSRTLTLEVDQPTDADVRFKLVGRDPAGTEPVQLTMLEVRYSYDGSICGMASRPLVIGRADHAELDLPAQHGTPWLAQAGRSSVVDVKQDPDAADLTIEIFKTDGNSGNGSYTCHLISPHALTCSLGPFKIELAGEAKGFARELVNQLDAYNGKPGGDGILVSYGRRIARALGPGVITALHEVADRVKPAVPTVLLVSAEPYVPWELAYLDPPLVTGRPNYLGVQAEVGRWLREHTGISDKPPLQPPSRIGVKHMAVMAGMYKAESGLNRLPKAEDEAKALQQTYDAVPLAASLQAVTQMLNAKLEHNFETIGGVEAVHFAGHGDYNTHTPDSAVIYLSDGTPLFASLFGSALYGGAQTPLLFLNACLAGIGDQLLGDAGGFPGNALDGGFGAMLGALWKVDDELAYQIAIEFWQRALPLGGTQAEPVGAILRDLRAKYVPDPLKATATTYLAYVYYGHPRLTLQKIA